MRAVLPKWQGLNLRCVNALTRSIRSGNTTAATGKGFAPALRQLTALALMASYIDKVKAIKPDFAFDLSIMNPSVLIGAVYRRLSAVCFCRSYNGVCG